jgi:hypothetical protein
MWTILIVIWQISVPAHTETINFRSQYECDQNVKILRETFSEKYPIEDYFVVSDCMQTGGF